MMIGTVLGDRYELIEKIGEGGMAEVYRAKCHKLNRFDAVKILKKEFSNDTDLVEKFKKEATAVANLSDNNIVNIFDVGSQEDVNYIVMEYVKGKTLKQIIRESGRIGYEKAIDIAMQIAKALDCAHRNNIIHRDVKPQNILVTEDGIVKVTDFGIAKSPDSATITNSKRILGSAHYFSPEQAKGTYVDFRTDIYSLGIVLYEMVTGRVPFEAESPVSVALKHIQEPVVPPKEINEEIPESLNKLILKAIEKEPIKRYQTAKDLLNDLIRIQKNSDCEIVYNVVDDDHTRIMKPVNIDDEDEYEEEDEKEGISSKKKKYIILSLVGVLVIALGVITAALLTKGMAPKPQAKEKVVPKIIGLSKEDAKKALEAEGFKMEIVSTDKSDQPEGTILKCFPEEGKTAKQDVPVRVVVSGGVSTAKVPSLEGKDLKSAKELLATYELEAGNIDSAFSDTVENGAVIKQDPEADKAVPKGTKVNLVISKGKEKKFTKVPGLLKSTISQAEDQIKNSKLVIDKKTEETSDKSLDQKVKSQSIPEGTEVTEGTTISVVYYVYKEPQKVNVSDLVGRKISEAKAIAKERGITLNVGGFGDDETIAQLDKNEVLPGGTVTVTNVKKVEAKPPTPPTPTPKP